MPERQCQILLLTVMHVSHLLGGGDLASVRTRKKMRPQHTALVSAECRVREVVCVWVSGESFVGGCAVYGSEVEEGRCKATWKREFELPWCEAGPPNHHDDEVNSDPRLSINNSLSGRGAGFAVTAPHPKEGAFGDLGFGVSRMAGQGGSPRPENPKPENAVLGLGVWCRSRREREMFPSLTT